MGSTATRGRVATMIIRIIRLSGVSWSFLPPEAVVLLLRGPFLSSFPKRSRISRPSSFSRARMSRQ